MLGLKQKPARCFVMDRAVFGPGIALSEGQVVVVPAGVDAPDALIQNGRPHYGSDENLFPHGALVWDDVAYRKATNPKPEPSRPPVTVDEPTVLAEFGWTKRELQLAMNAAFPPIFSEKIGPRTATRTWQRTAIDNWLKTMAELGFVRQGR